MRHAFLPLFVVAVVLSVAAVAPAVAASSIPPAPDHVAEFASELLRNHAYLFSQAELAEIDRLNRDIRESQRLARRSQGAAGKSERQARAGRSAVELLHVLEKSAKLTRITLPGGAGQAPASLELPGNNGTMLLRIEDGEGETQCRTVRADFAHMEVNQNTVSVDVQPGVTWALVGLVNVPVARTHIRVELHRRGGEVVTWPVELHVPSLGRLKVRILSDETNEPVPAMVRLTWKSASDPDRMPSNAVDLSDQFDSQGRLGSYRPVNSPDHAPDGSYWCVPGPFDMEAAPGDYSIIVRRGIEHEVIEGSFSVKSGETTERTYTVHRYVDMRKQHWYSGDDHVHCRIVSDDDARRLMLYAQAEDVHLCNIVKMGDINRTWFEQRGFGKDYRVIDGDYILSPGQECPRTHEQIGHTLAMNTTSMVRDTDKYFLYDWVADTVHAQGGLWGYAHTSSGIFYVHRDMSINVPKKKCDFVEVLQFAQLGTGLFYDFLNLGFKMTASAGSDVPWGGTVGEVRVYAWLNDKPFSADAWFDAVRRGRTFVSSGPMLDLQVEEARPGDEVRVSSNRKLHVRAKAWGDPQRALPVKLSIVRLGEVIREATSPPGEKEAVLEFDVDSGNGFWIAARADGADGTAAHTTPVYVIRDGLRFWKYDAVEKLVEKRMGTLGEVDGIIHAAQATTQPADRATAQLALQGGELRRRVQAAREIYQGLLETARKESAVRSREP